MSNYLNKIVYLTENQYSTLVDIGSITVNGVTYQYDQNTLYITNTNLITVPQGGTNITSYTVGDILYASGNTTLSVLNGNTTTTRKFLRSVAATAGTAVAPEWDTLTANDIPTITKSKISDFSHAHGNITNGGLLDNANRLVWTTSDKKIYAGYHYAATDRIAINSSSAPSYTLYVNGTGYYTDALTVSKANGANNFGIYVEHTNPNNNTAIAKKIAMFIGGSTGNGGLYDVTKSKWIVYSDTSGNVTLNGNALTATSATTAASATNDSDGNAINSTYFKLTETRAATTSNTFSITNSTASDSTSAGALVVSGGIATGANSYLNYSVHIVGSASNNPLITRGISGSGTNGNRDNTAANKELYLNYNGGLVQVGFTETTAVSTNMLKIAYISNSSSTSTGALVVDGGVGIAKKLYVGSDIIVNNLTIDYTNNTLQAASGTALRIKTVGNDSIIFGKSNTDICRIDTDGCFRPDAASNTMTVGTNSYKWYAMYATTFYGTLSGNATSATSIKVNSAATTKSWITGTSTTLGNTASTINADSFVYLTTTEGEISAKKYSINDGASTPIEKIRFEYNSTDDSLDFIFL